MGDFVHLAVEIRLVLPFAIVTKRVEAAFVVDDWLNPLASAARFEPEPTRKHYNTSCWQPVAAIDPAAHGFTRAASMASANR